VRITADTNVLLRAVVADDPDQTRLAQALLAEAELVAMPLAVLCEFVWVSRSAYRLPAREIGNVIRTWLMSLTVRLDRPAVEAGLAMLDAGGDFADGVIAYSGREMGGSVFASFDRRAIDLVAAADGDVLLPGAPG
jgi:predicted nucleic-acid-binding protein